MRLAAGLSLLLCISARAQTPVILISIDTLRGDAIGQNTPNILAYAGTRFTSAQSQIPLTLPSHTTLLTSTYPHQNGVEENADKVPQGLTTLAQVLKARGYQTAAFIGSIFLERQLGLDQGFDTYDSPFDFNAFSRLSGEMLATDKSATAYNTRERRAGPLVLRPATQWLAQHKGQPAFVFIHLFDMHKPWRQRTYQSQAAAVDEMLGTFAASLKQQGWWDRALIVIVSDHGEGLGDHGESDHGYFIYQSTLHVPLIVHWPRGAAALPAQYEHPVGLIDVAPAILDFLNIPAPPSFRGHSFLKTPPRTVLGESVYARDAFGWAALRTLREGQWKYIEAPRPELYNLDKDPNELNNLSATAPAQANKLKSQLPAYNEVAPQPITRNKEVLESLGYLAPGPKAMHKGSAADPKDKLPELLRYEDAVTLLQRKQTTRAMAIFRAILAADPDNLLARRDYGVALIEVKRFKEAIAELQKVNTASPGDYITQHGLAVATEAANRR